MVADRSLLCRPALDDPDAIVLSERRSFQVRVAWQPVEAASLGQCGEQRIGK